MSALGRMYLSAESIQCQLEGTVCACVITQRCQCKPGTGSGVENVLVKMRTDAVEQHLACLADAAAQNQIGRAHV